MSRALALIEVSAVQPITLLQETWSDDVSRSRCVSARRGLQTAWRVGVVLACMSAVISPINASEPANAGAAHSRAETQFAEGLRLAAADKLPAAIDVFVRLTQEYPQLPQPYAQLAALYVRQGEPVKAIAPLERALKLNTDEAALQEQLGDLYVELAARAYTAAGATRGSARDKATALTQPHQDQSSNDGRR